MMFGAIAQRLLAFAPIVDKIDEGVLVHACAQAAFVDYQLATYRCVIKTGQPAEVEDAVRLGVCGVARLCQVVDRVSWALLARLARAALPVDRHPHGTRNGAGARDASRPPPGLWTFTVERIVPSDLPALRAQRQSSWRGDNG